MNPTTLLAPTETDALDALRSRVAGDIYAPDDAGWDDARRAWNLAVDQRPALVALPESADDVLAIVDYAREHRLHIAPQGTGHNAGPLELAGAILVKTERMREISVDPAARTARVGAGVVWGEVYDVTVPHGLVALAGSSHDVGVVGYSLGGGIGWLARKHGTASNSITAIELVTSYGHLVRATAEEHSELFWAMRGGGGSFGIVTALEFALYPLEELYAGWLFFPYERAHEVVAAYAEWTADLPDEITSALRLLQFPPLPEIPEPVRGQSFAVIEAAFLGDEAAGAELLAPLRALGPIMDTFATVPAMALRDLHQDPPGPVPGKGDGMLVRDLTPEAVDAFVAAGGPGSGSPLLALELRHLGGALARRTPDKGALSGFSAKYALFAVGIAPIPEMAAAVEAHLDVVAAHMEPHRSGSYLNFAERRVDTRAMFDEDVHHRLVWVKEAYDPADLFRSNHPIR